MNKYEKGWREVNFPPRDNFLQLQMAAYKKEAREMCLHPFASGEICRDCGEDFS